MGTLFLLFCTWMVFWFVGAVFAEGAEASPASAVLAIACLLVAFAAKWGAAIYACSLIARRMGWV